MMTKRSLRPTTGMLLATLVVAGCGLVQKSASSGDDLSTWSDHPLQPDAALAKRVLDGGSACNAPGPAGQGAAIRILLQDRRTLQTAAFLVSTVTTFGSCMVTSGSGMTGGGSGPLPAALAGDISIDEDSTGDAGSTVARVLGGRIDERVVHVTILLADGRTVVASVGDGYWLGWWPDTTTAKTVSGTDDSGAPLAVGEVDQ